MENYCGCVDVGCLVVEVIIVVVVIAMVMVVIVLVVAVLVVVVEWFLWNYYGVSGGCVGGDGLSRYLWLCLWWWKLQLCRGFVVVVW